MVMFSVRVPQGCAERFDAAAGLHGGRSALLRRLIAQAAEGEATASGAGRFHRPARLMVRLTLADAAGASAAADAMGLSRSAWVAGLVRRHVHGRPTFSRADATDLSAIRGELRRIGVNVNQIARALNTAVQEGQVLRLEMDWLAELRAEIAGHVTALGEAFEGSLDYWAVDR